MSIAAVYMGQGIDVSEGLKEPSKHPARRQVARTRLGAAISANAGPLFVAMMVFVNGAGFVVPQLYSQVGWWKDNVKDEEDPVLKRRYRSFNQANVPPLRSWYRGDTSYGASFNHFDRLGSEAYAPRVGTNCSAVLREALEAQLAPLNGQTDPARMQVCHAADVGSNV